MVIQHNLQSLNANRQTGMVTGSRQKSAEKLSSGYKINRAADDAAGLSISEKMRRQMRGLGRSVKNGKDGISFVQIADGALHEVHDMLQRGNVLAIQAANGTLSEGDRIAINNEIVALKKEIDSITSRTKFNETSVFVKGGVVPEKPTTNIPEKVKTSLELLADKVTNEYYPTLAGQLFELAVNFPRVIPVNIIQSLRLTILMVLAKRLPVCGQPFQYPDRDSIPDHFRWMWIMMIFHRLTLVHIRCSNLNLLLHMRQCMV